MCKNDALNIIPNHDVGAFLSSAFPSLMGHSYGIITSCLPIEDVWVLISGIYISPPAAARHTSANNVFRPPLEFLTENKVWNGEVRNYSPKQPNDLNRHGNRLNDNHGVMFMFLLLIFWQALWHRTKLEAARRPPRKDETGSKCQKGGSLARATRKSEQVLLWVLDGTKKTWNDLFGGFFPYKIRLNEKEINNENRQTCKVIHNS